MGKKIIGIGGEEVRVDCYGPNISVRYGDKIVFRYGVTNTLIGEGYILLNYVVTGDLGGRSLMEYREDSIKKIKETCGSGGK